MFRFYDRFYVWGQIEPNNLNIHIIIEIEIFGHFGCRLLFSQMISLLTKNMKKNVRNI